MSIKSDYVGPLNVLARVLSSHPDKEKRNASEAIAFAERAAELTGHKDVRVLETLALAYAANEEYELAISAAQKAQSIATSAQNDKLAERIGRQLKIYELQKP